MKKLLHITVLLLATFLVGCYKDDVDVEALRNNPFDRDYDGPAVFEAIGTYTQQVSTGQGNVLYQVIEFRVREDLFLAPATYGVRVTDLLSDMEADATPLNPGGNLFKYQRQPVPGQQVCLELRLSNNLSTAGAETICVTL
jgi:hypothetical protein